jgi:hypothetical protein
MATRSRIAMEQEDGSVLSIYCHNDGYVEHNGYILQTHYQDPEKVKELIELGDISSLGKNVSPSGPHSFNQPERDVVVAYGRDRGESDIAANKDQSVSAFFSFLPGFEDYGYLFTQEGEWLVKKSSEDGDPVPLSYVISGVIEF